MFVTVCFTDIGIMVVHRYTANVYVGAQEVNLRDIPEVAYFLLDDRDPLTDCDITACRAPRPVNSCGDFLIAEWKIRERRDNLESKSNVVFIEVRFNVNMCNFSFLNKSLPFGPWATTATSLYPDIGHDYDAYPSLPTWNDQAVLVLHATSDRSSVSKTNLQLQAQRSTILTVLPVSRSTTPRANASISSLHVSTGSHAKSILPLIPRLTTLEIYFAEKNLCVDSGSRTTIKVFNGLDANPVPLASLHALRRNSPFLKSLCSESDFTMDLSETWMSLKDRQYGTDCLYFPHHIFQDDHFIVLFHRHGYIAWDFRADISSGRT